MQASCDWLSTQIAVYASEFSILVIVSFDLPVFVRSVSHPLVVMIDQTDKQEKLKRSKFKPKLLREL